jgi:superoxide dismutase
MYIYIYTHIFSLVCLHPRDRDIINETAATGDASIRQRKQPLGMNMNELLSRVTQGFNSQNSPRNSEIIKQIAVKGDGWV